MTFILPGENDLCTSAIKQKINTTQSESTLSTIKLGPGLIRSADHFRTIHPGMIRSINNGRFWLDFEQKSYFPVTGDAVLGVVKGVYGDFYRIDIGWHTYAVLDNLAFESATKRNRPILSIGSIVYARIILANRDIEPEISCVGENGKSCGFGVLPFGGHLTKISSLLARGMLFEPRCSIIRAIEKENLTFEMAVGINGQVWMRGSRLEETHFLVLLFDLLGKKVKFCNEENVSKMIDKCIEKAKELSQL